MTGIGCTRFGKRDDATLRDLAENACQQAIKESGIERRDIEAFYLGNYGSGMLVGQELTASVVANRLGLGHIPATKVEGACASGGIAIRHGAMLIASGAADTVLVAGVEKMTSAPTDVVTEALAGASDTEAAEGRSGLTFPGFFATMAQRHMYEFGTTPEQLAQVAHKNRQNAQQNPRAQFHGKPADMDDIMGSRLIADPLRLFDCSPISDGAAAVVLTAADRVPDSDHPVDILSIEQGTGPATLGEMSSLVSVATTVDAGERAFEAAGVERSDIDVVEVHDCFSIAEIVALEDLGFVPKGEGGPAVESGLTGLDGELPVNPDGGLLSKGHPVGATGLAQCYELCRQLRGTADNQVDSARIGLMHNLGGTGGTVAVGILAARGVM